MATILPITKARQQFPTLVDRANRLAHEYVITVNGRPAAVLMSAAEYESWKETSEILSDPELMQAIREAEEDIKAGRVYDLEEVERELGWNVQSKVDRKSKKRAQSAF